MWANTLIFISAYKIGDLASLAGVLISLVGFAVTVVSVLKSRRAAERAQIAAKAARDGIRLFETVVDFTQTISTLEELKRAHRYGQWQILPDRYAAVRKVLISLRTSNPGLTERQNTVIQEALSNLRLYETNVERGLSSGGAPNAAKLNASLSRDIDDLVAVLGEIKMASTGG